MTQTTVMNMMRSPPHETRVPRMGCRFSEWSNMRKCSQVRGQNPTVGAVDRELLCEDERLDALLELAEHIGIERLFGL